MSDRELLELAAKAAESAGMPMIVETEAGPQIRARITQGCEIYRCWNPLEDDADALRLAVKLDIPVSPESVNGTVWICKGDMQVYESFGTDPLAATRRAIVRAAAEIGRRPVSGM